MNGFRRPGLLLVLVALLFAPAAAADAQRGSSGRLRRPYVDIAPEGDVDAILRENLEQLGELNKVKSLLEMMAGDSDLLRKRLKGLQDAGGDFDFGNEETKKKALELIEDMKKRDPDVLRKAAKKLNLDGGQLQKDLDRLKDDSTADVRPKQDAQAQGTTGNQPKTNRLPDISDAESGEKVVDSVKDWLKRMEGESGLSGLLRDSPAIQKAMDEVATSFLNGAGDGARWDAGAVADNLNRAAGLFDNAFSFFENAGRLPTPSWPALNLPSFGGSLPSFGTPSFGGAPGVEAGTGAWQALMWVGVVVALGLILWQVLSRLKTSAAERGDGSGWRLGAWPVDPAKVATPAEIIQAFEFLSLLILGLPARTWNHRDIAVGIGGTATGDSAEKAAAAERLAFVYEHARYAPGTDSLPGEELASARRDLCFLAGVMPS